MSAPSQFEIELGRAIRSAFGTNTKVVRFGDDQGVDDCFIVSGFDCPVEGVTSYGSVGLSRATQQTGAVPVLVEIVAACATATPYMDNLVSSCMFDSLKNGSNIAYGAFIPDILVQYGMSRTLNHVTFVAPFLWEGLGKLVVEGQPIHCLLAVPISDGEGYFLKRNGIDALEELFEERQIDIYDINRPSAVG